MTDVDVSGNPFDYGTPDNVKPTGAHCCRALTLFWTFEDLAASYEAAVAGAKTFVRPATGEEFDLPRDILTIGPMVRLVGVCDRNPLAEGKFKEPRKVWRCIHQRPDFSCGIYDRRPWMCRTYPGNQEGGLCQYVYCQSTGCPAYSKKRPVKTSPAEGAPALSGPDA